MSCCDDALSRSSFACSVALEYLIDRGCKDPHAGRLDFGLLDGAAEIDPQQFLTRALPEVVKEGDLKCRGAVGGQCHAHLSRREVEVARAVHHHGVGAELELV